MKISILLISIIFTNSILAQVNYENIIINGEVQGKIVEHDSLYLINGFIDKKYFEIPFYSSEIIYNRFNLKLKLSYPHMYKIAIKSDRGIKPFIAGDYFIDQQTNTIKLNSIPDLNEINGQNSREYLNDFIPFFENDIEARKFTGTFYTMRFNKNPIFDTLLLAYVIKNPDSFVALWNLILRYTEYGQSDLRDKILENFSANMKKNKLWQLLQEDVINIH
ncbi:MAG: hypothetical protein U0W24_03965 [Bacteroidales bacterium]